MTSEMESPAARRGNPVTVELDGCNSPETNSSLRTLQASRLTRRCAISVAMAAIVAPLIFGEAQQ
jgi:hypothetical protein